MMQSVLENIETSVDWSGVLTDLTARRGHAQDRVAELKRRKQEISLESAMGSDPARKELTKINAELVKFDLEREDLASAIQRAESQKAEAQRVEAEANERQRRDKIGRLLAQHLAAVEEIDAHMEQLAIHFRTAMEFLDSAEALMAGQERVPFAQVRSAWGPTAAAGFHKLGRYIEIGWQGGAGNQKHHQPLATYTVPFVERWIAGPDKSEPDQNAKEK